MEIKKLGLKGLTKTKKTKKHLKPLKLVRQSLFKLIEQKSIFYSTFTKNLTLLPPVPHWAGDSTNLHSNKNISKVVRVNVTFTERF